jgi:probable HAF family extracellular repeat protein
MPLCNFSLERGMTVALLLAHVLGQRLRTLTPQGVNHTRVETMKSTAQVVLTIASLVSFLTLPGISQNKPLTDIPPGYDLVNLGTPLGGSFAIGLDINRLGIIAGYGNLPGDERQHMFLYWFGLSKDMGTLGGPNSAVLGNFSGFSEPDRLDPLGQDFCSTGTGDECLPVTIQSGKVEELPLLGGFNGAAFGNNDVGEVVGNSQTTLIDDGCLPIGFSQQFVPTYWEHGKVHRLPMPHGDMEGWGFSVNDSGQIVGSTGTCTANPYAHAVLWDNGKPINLGTFGGSMYNYASSINNSGDVTGASDLAGDATGHAFLWHKGKLIDLGTLPGDVESEGISINNLGEIVGESCDVNGNCRFFLWQRGTMTDLGTLLPADSPLSIQVIEYISDNGALVGFAYDPTTETSPAILVVPDYKHASIQSSAESVKPFARLAIPSNGAKNHRFMPGHFQSRIPKP